MVSSINRPDPEELLRRIEAGEHREKRGRLKIFLGYASRVGKSFRMFDEGRRRKDRGQDVVVAAVQGKPGGDIEDLLSRFEVIAPDSGGGIDLPAIFQRHPSVCLIDGLAFDNPPGSRHAQRWQDVEDILQQGIAVITSVNLQHVREQQDAVERVTSKRAAYSVPQAFLAEADEIEIVDAPPEALIGRGAGAGMPDPRSLAELRELALLLAADVVDHQLRAYVEAHGITTRWGTQERILVCLTPRSSAADMLRSGYRNALRFHGALLAAYMPQSNLRMEDQQRLESHLDLARQCGAEVHCLEGDDFVRSILEFAREQRITQVFLGHSKRESRFGLKRNPIDRLIDAAEDFDVRLFPHGDG